MVKKGQFKNLNYSTLDEAKYINQLHGIVLQCQHLTRIFCLLFIIPYLHAYSDLFAMKPT